MGYLEELIDSMIKPVVVTASLLMVALAQVASADISGTVTFTQPIVHVGSTDQIPVYLTLTLDPASDPVDIDSSGQVTDLSTSQIQANLFGSFTDSNNNSVNYTFDSSDTFSVVPNEDITCSGNFFVGCGGPGSAYDYNFGFAPQGFNGQTSLDLAPGSATTYLLATFIPAGAGAPSGTYNLPNADLFFQVYDDSVLDSNSQALHIADVYFNTDESAGFTAIVTPEPGFYGFLGLGLTGLLVSTRRFASRRHEN
jgi:hypothetical protein